MEDEKISIRNKGLIISIALILFFVMGAAAAANETDTGIAQEADVQETSLEEDVVQDVITQDETQNSTLEQTDQSPTVEDSQKVPTTIKSSDKNIVKGSEFSVKLTDDNSVPIADKEVKFTFNKVVTKANTDSNGIAKLKINANPGEYTVKYSFAADGYSSCENTSKIFVITSSKTKVTGADYKAYVGFNNLYTVLFTVGGNPLGHKWVTFTINGKKYPAKTTLKGNAMINIKEAPGKYKIYYSFGGEKNINAVTGKSKITVKKKMPTKIYKAYTETYVHKQKGYFKVVVKDARGNVLAKKKVVFKLNGKKIVKKTNSKGIATYKVKLGAGKYKLKVWTYENSKYYAAKRTYTIKVRSLPPQGNGMWLFGKDMKSVDFNKLEKNGFKHILLNFKAIELYGKSGVEKWIKEASKHGIKVHIWMQVFYSGGEWQNPVSGGSINYGLINSKVSEAKSYAKVKGVAGVHFDYVRYPGTAHNYANSVNAVNTFIKKATSAIHGVNKNLIVSAAVMPEPSGMEYYYGQDISTMGRYLDAIIPMVYKGNYHAGDAWIKSVTQTFAKQSKKAKIWTGLQTYESDEDLKMLSANELRGDARAAYNGGAAGVILFRFGLFNYINFKEM